MAPADPPRIAAPRWPQVRPPTAYAMDAYLRIVSMGGSEEAACKAAMAAEQREYQENAAYWINRCVTYLAKQPPAPMILTRDPTNPMAPLETGIPEFGGRAIEVAYQPPDKPKRRRRRGRKTQ